MPLPKEPVVLASDGRDPWDRQPGEGKRPYDQFIVYRDLGRTRHYKKVAERFGLTVATAAQYSRVYRWVERSAAYDKFMDSQWVAALSENSRRLAREHVRVGRRMLQIIEQRLETMDPDNITTGDFVRMTELWSRLGRVAVGEPDAHVALTGHTAHPPVMVTTVPADEETRQQQMQGAATELARRLAARHGVSAEDILEMDL